MVQKHGPLHQSNKKDLMEHIQTYYDGSRISTRNNTLPPQEFMVISLLSLINSLRDVPNLQVIVLEQVEKLSHLSSFGSLHIQTILTDLPTLMLSLEAQALESMIFLLPWLTVWCGKKLCILSRPRPQDDDDDDGFI